ncbi:MAG: hypothetical protein KTR25_00775 [Myxococcales bacterium]|nr:hypothetical protein [Myxococcales bacterium]
MASCHLGTRLSDHSVQKAFPSVQGVGEDAAYGGCNRRKAKPTRAVHEKTSHCRIARPDQPAAKFSVGALKGTDKAANISHFAQPSR